jgi:TRAP-type mannitol/chloroaromatic compound transport system substrate-binding protein
MVAWTGQPISPPGTLETENMEDLINRIKVASNGRLDITLHPTGAIVPSAQEFDGVDLGTLEFGNTAPSYQTDRWAAAGPFAFIVGGLTGMEYAAWMTVGGGGDLAREMYSDTDVQLIDGWLVTPPEAFLQSTVPLQTVADIKGLKIRTAGDDGELFARMDAAVVFLPGEEIYEALQRGVIDAAQLSTPAIDWTFAIQEVADYMYLSPVRQPSDPTWILVNKQAWADLPDDLKQVVEEVTFAQGHRWYDSLLVKDIAAVQQFKDYGTVVEPASKAIEDELSRQAEIFYNEKAAEDPFYARVLDSIRSFRDAVREAWPAGL